MSQHASEDSSHHLIHHRSPQQHPQSYLLPPSFLHIISHSYYHHCAFYSSHLGLPEPLAHSLDIYRDVSSRSPHPISTPPCRTGVSHVSTLFHRLQRSTYQGRTTQLNTSTSTSTSTPDTSASLPRHPSTTHSTPNPPSTDGKPPPDIRARPRPAPAPLLCRRRARRRGRQVCRQRRGDTRAAVLSHAREDDVGRPRA